MSQMTYMRANKEAANSQVTGEEQYARADDYYARRNLLPRCIQRLRLNAELEKKKRVLQAQAAEFYREGQLGRCFYRWCHSFQLSQDIRMMERMAFLHHESILGKRFFTEWMERTRSKLKESEKMYQAIDHHHLSLCTKVLGSPPRITSALRIYYPGQPANTIDILDEDN
ncbi:uncharacterized protein LOC115927867 [Strongylocentrotus purpuratus]|uniref:Uncharacterized protein n=1 Tax=Strongylocentrotus purpuratus TaxID=7668 RepID=A0A7M7PEP4_STRPU|nr:uncharacterized protein LOC115927867 [Strongylocentrotus purpuratus]